MRVALVDAGGANLGSVRYALERLGIAPEIVRDPEALARADRIILPGVGAAAPAMAALRAQGLDRALHAATAPVLGICLGMQLLYEGSDESDTACLGLLPGRVRRLPATPGLRIPHMGWNALADVADTPLLRGIANGDCVYFVHGYAAPVGDDTVASARHGDAFSAVVSRGLYCGAQFHPERSANAGARLLENFIRWDS
ncbi:imidazole glycerol phosphate synthase subunit HisH [Luteimonas sp. SX5]|uniref:Imidazole glycerol phosphate synthase subunit HisH n=1 Tax=Luteimonas galliterrae TaxID=2940486 RepID=A0ABT0MG98_9GAMM|nr:imidazole glycerol phosphate synthase subunit HisH [Luteimonas galliterrae]MCL1633897.1 imidazole glycerol phosphate synthase subunit HisH [Luteimonas galliterrae]